MDFTILSPLSKKTYHINWIEINTPKGNFVIQPGHAPIVIALSKKRPITFGLINGKRESMIIQDGIITIERTHAIVITSQDL